MADRDAMLPLPYRVLESRLETADTVSLRLAPVAEQLAPFRPGQFTMLYLHGIGEIAVSISGDSGRTDGTLVQTIRDVGAVSAAAVHAQPGALIGVRGPYGTDWGMSSARDHDLLIVAGGLGLAPLRPVLYAAVADRASYRRVILIAGARQPAELLFGDELASWTAAGIEIHRTVDQAAGRWTGSIGFVTEPLARLELRPYRTVAFVCGPEPMMQHTAELLVDRQLPPELIRISLERNMKCGIGVCGHCQLGPLLLCRQGPITDYRQAGPLLEVVQL
ncbi:MAG: FAD/NAD(P)-binding protein [Jatrophihabitantaceae bacterium]